MDSHQPGPMLWLPNTLSGTRKDFEEKPLLYFCAAFVSRRLVYGPEVIRPKNTSHNELKRLSNRPLLHTCKNRLQKRYGTSKKSLQLITHGKSTELHTTLTLSAVTHDLFNPTQEAAKVWLLRQLDSFEKGYLFYFDSQLYF